MSKTKIRRTKIFSILMVVLAATAGWAFYSFINTAIDDLLLTIGISNFYFRTGIIIVGILIILSLSGLGVAKTINKIIE